MFDQMKLGTKIWLGFGALLLISSILGGVAVISMMDVRTESNMLAQEYVPEVLLANEIERNSLNTMYNIRGYQFTGDENHFLIPGKKALANVEEGMKQIEELAEKSPHLVKLKQNLPDAKANVEEYKKLLEETVKIEGELHEIAKELNHAGGQYMKSVEILFNTQDKKLEEDINKNSGRGELLERVEKLTMITKMNNTGHEIRLARMKSLGERDVAIVESILPHFEKITEFGASLDKVFHDPKDKEELHAVLKDAKEYKEGTVKEIALRQKLNEISTLRGKTAEAVLSAAEKTSIAGAEETKKIALSAATSLSVASTMMVFGLAFAVALGLGVAFVVTRSIVNLIMRICNSLAEASTQVNNASQELSSSAQQLASSSSEQASSIEETTASLEEMGGMVSNNVSNATSAAELSQKVSGISEIGNEKMDQLQDSMKEILESNDQVEELVKVMSAIGEKTKVMDEIVFQTKLLSFNASVEAERAGEHGRGFAVVAQEVGNLAQMSGQAAQEISHILTESIKTAKDITIANRKKVENGANLVTDTAKALKEILQSANSVKSGANQVLDASKEQAQGIKQINTAMSNLEKATQENAAQSEEVASTSEELGAQTEMLNSAVKQLYMMVNGVDTRGGAGMQSMEKAGNSHGNKMINKSSDNIYDIKKAREKKQIANVPRIHRGEKEKFVANSGEFISESGRSGSISSNANDEWNKI
ncbi:MAG: MCP four helix bundle domain-containing protein [Oligoflexia bacterium]|nr:MCP four helix bundle domain-containing protein [Oligoflexia bacterium]MBF0366766.1 MCP four helix bundle domain-containing protein [Oligoflexia bacterium]